jgi:dihydroxy-acid dehydratase
MAYLTGKRIVDMVFEDLRPSKIITREACINALRLTTAIGGSSNCPPHLIAIARHAGVAHTIHDWDEFGHGIPLLVNCQPAGEFLGERFHKAGGVPAVLAELRSKGLLFEQAMTVTGRTLGDNLSEIDLTYVDRAVIRSYDEPLRERAGFLVLSGNLFDTAVMKTSVIGEAFRAKHLSNPDHPMAFEGRVQVFEGPEDYHARINDPALDIDEATILVIRGCGPVGYPGSAEVVNMLPPDRLIKAGIKGLPCIGDGRQSGTSASPSILNASPEAAAGGGLALLRSGDIIRVDLAARRVDALVPPQEWEQRRKAGGTCSVPEDATPWQRIYRREVTQLDEGGVLASATEFRNVANAAKPPRHSH